MSFTELITLIVNPAKQVDRFVIHPEFYINEGTVFDYIVTHGGYQPFAWSGSYTYGFFFHNDVIYIIESDDDTHIRFSIYEDRRDDTRNELVYRIYVDAPYWLLIRLIENKSNGIDRRMFVFSPKLKQQEAFTKVCTIPCDSYVTFGSNGNKTYGYFKYGDNIYIIESEFDTPIHFAMCNPSIEKNTFPNRGKKPTYDLNSFIPRKLF